MSVTPPPLPPSQQPPQVQAPVEPPPLPVEPLSYATPVISSDENKKDIFHQAAKASWRAPFIAFIFGLVTVVAREQNRTIAMVVGGLNALIILLGLAFAIVALAGVRGRKRILLPATIGLVLNLLLVSLTVSYLLAARHQTGARSAMVASVGAASPSGLPAVPPFGGGSSSAAQGANPNLQLQQRAREAMENYPGWVGASLRSGQFVIVVAQSNDDAPGTHDLKDQFAADCTLISIATDNTAGDAAHTIDPASLEFHFADYHKLAVLPPVQILSTSKVDREQFLARWGGLIRIDPHTQRPDGLAFLPPRTDLTQCTAVTLILDGQRVVVPGKYLSIEEKNQRLRMAKQQQQQQQQQQQPVRR